VLTVAALLAAVGLVWCLLVGMLWWQQDRLVFVGWGFGLAAVTELAPSDERLEVAMPDGVRLVGGLRRARHASRGLLVVFGGNAEDNAWRLRHFDDWLDDVDIATFYYRGYGPSGGTPDQAVLIEDAARIVDYLQARMRPERLVAAGFSLGSGVVAHLARVRPLAGAILVTPFDSIAAVAAERYPYAPVRWLLRHPFRSDAALAGVDVPVAVIAASGDRVVSPDRTKQLLAVLARPLSVTWIAGATHISIYDRAEYRVAFLEALDLLLGSSRRSVAAVAIAGETR
jgi:pimeloyl-ACP methyl ester carboxylesterase